MKKIHLKYLAVMAMVIFMAMVLSGCYTQLGKPGSGYSYYDDEREVVYEQEEEYVSNRADTIIIHKPSRYDVYVHDWYPTVFINAWWYEPYWYYRSSFWWRWHHYWDPWWGYSFYWGDPYYWPPLTFYGGWVYYSYWYDPYYYDYGYYYGPGVVRVQKRRDFAYGQGPGIEKLGVRPRPAVASPMAAANTVKRSWAPRGASDRGVSAVDEYYNRDTRRSLAAPEGRGTINAPRSSTGQLPSPSVTKRGERPIESGNNEAVRRSTPKTSAPEGRSVTKQPRPSSERASSPEIKKSPTPPSNSEQGVRKSGSRPSSERSNDSSSGTIQKRSTPGNQSQSYSAPRRTSEGSSHFHRSSNGSSSSLSRSSSRSSSQGSWHSGSSSSSGHNSSSSRSSGSSSSGSSARRR